MESKRVYHVHLREPYNGKQDYYFGSLTAIYVNLPEDVLGVKYTSLKAKKFTGYENNKCVIKVDQLIRNERKHGAD